MTWSPVYELHATTEAGIPAPSVSLHYRARVTQSTGEDWTDVNFTLSTADMDLSNQTVPVLSPTKIRPPRSLFGFGASGYMQAQQHPPQAAFAQQHVTRAVPGVFGQSAFGASAPPTIGQPMQITCANPEPMAVTGSLPRRDISTAAEGWEDVSSDGAAAEEPTPIGEPTSVVHESPLALTYHVESASSVPSDGVSHQVSVAVLPFEAKILHVTVPKARPVTYLEASVKNTSDYRLLPGPVNAFVDDSFVSRTAISGGDVAPGDTFSCTLGADPATRIRYSRTSKRAEEDARTRASAFSEQWEATTYRSCTTVMNRHPFPLRTLVLRDSVPVTEDDKRVNVILRHPDGLADLEQGRELKVSEQRTVRWCKIVDGKGGKKEGLFEWVFEVGAGAEVTIETKWDVKAPVSLRWVEST